MIKRRGGAARSRIAPARRRGRRRGGRAGTCRGWAACAPWPRAAGRQWSAVADRGSPALRRANGRHTVCYEGPMSDSEPVRYDPEYIRRYYDTFGEREWDRFAAEAPAVDLVNFHIHRWYLQHYIRPGDRVLEAGAGPGRFTLELVRLGAQVLVGDISPGQLALNA